MHRSSSTHYRRIRSRNWSSKAKRQRTFGRCCEEGARSTHPRTHGRACSRARVLTRARAHGGLRAPVLALAYASPCARSRANTHLVDVSLVVAFVSFLYHHMVVCALKIDASLTPPALTIDAFHTHD
eukprot:2561544-Pleurochrysis_carterae.AAC.1